jgi:FlaA1/EpsC-like NDP-sugar epimerase
MKYFLKLFENILNLETKPRRILLFFIDIFILIQAFLLSIWFTNGNEFLLNPWLITFYSIFGFSFYFVTGHYDGLTTYTGSKTFYRIGLRNFIFISVFSFFAFLSISYFNLKFWTTLYLLSSTSTGFIRLIIRDLVIEIKKKRKKKFIKVAIYGAGDAGAQLAENLNYEGGYLVKFFIDDNKELYNRTINGIKIRSPKDLKNKAKDIDQILFAIPSCRASIRNKIINNIQNYNIPILQVPSIKELASGKAEINSLRPISIEELLMRNPIEPNLFILNRSISNKVILVTGAGGSIGSEICKQIVNLNPKLLVLLDISELQLYKIKEILTKENKNKILIKYFLGNASDKGLIENILKTLKVNIIFHTAAYKHVPLVENNPLQGILNNVLTTKNLCSLAYKFEIEKLLLISTDKAVRPTNVMGASKRLSELIVQAYADSIKNKFSNTKNTKRTCFSMVRFGNVLDSSGSVVPLFKKQISESGPITVTHPEMTRYFMTIPEASQLVLQASLLAKGGEVFLLDMGEPVKIYNLALQMIRLSGLKLKNKENPNGDIEIVFTGKREGEKLYEELLIDSKATPTSHKLIFKAKESFIQFEKLMPNIKELEEAISHQKKKEALKILKKMVPEWQSSLY